jgi:two-component system nitrogen regulation sensor histidine kinase NtrY
MGFSNVKTAVLFRVGILLATTLSLAFLIADNGFIITELVLVILLVLQVVSLIKFMEKGNSEIISFLESIENDDPGQKFKTDSNNQELNRLNEALNKVLKNLHEVRQEKEADFQYIKNIVQHIGIGLITFEKSGKVQILNTAAKKLLKVNSLDNISDLKPLSENLVEILLRLRTGGRDLIRMEIGGDIER